MKFFNIIIGGVHHEMYYDHDNYRRGAELPIKFHGYVGPENYQVKNRMLGIIRGRPHMNRNIGNFDVHVEDYPHANVSHRFNYPVLLQMLCNYLDGQEFENTEHFTMFDIDNIPSNKSQYFNASFIRPIFDKETKRLNWDRYNGSTIYRESVDIRRFKNSEGEEFDTVAFDTEFGGNRLLEIVDKRIIGYAKLDKDQYIRKEELVPIWAVCMDIDLIDHQYRDDCKTFNTLPTLTDDSNVAILLELIKRDMDVCDSYEEDYLTSELSRLENIVINYDYEEEKEERELLDI